MLEEMSYEKRIESLLNYMSTSERVKKRMNGSLGLTLLGTSNDGLYTDFLYEAKECHLNPYGGVHGGVACTILDTCGGTCVLADSCKLPTTTDLTTSFIRPMSAHSFRIRIEFQLKGHHLYGVTGSIYDEKTGQLNVSSMIKYMLTDMPVNLVTE